MGGWVRLRLRLQLQGDSTQQKNTPALQTFAQHPYTPLHAPTQSELDRDISHCFVVESDAAPSPQPAATPRSQSQGAVAGFIVGWLIAGELQVLEMAVHPNCRRQGLGAALLRHLLQHCG